MEILEGEGGRKIWRKRLGKWGGEEKLDFGLMRGKSVWERKVCGNWVEGDCVVKGGGGDWEEGGWVCEVGFRDGKRGVDVVYVCCLMFVERVVYVVFGDGVRKGVWGILEG